MMTLVYSLGTPITKIIMLKSGVYAIKSPSGKLYVGSSVNLHKRWAEHRARLLRGVHHTPGLQHAYDKYGIESLVFEVLEYVTPHSLIETEQLYIDAHIGRLYNVCLIAGSRLGRKQNAQTRKKISDARKGRLCSEETKRRMSAAQTGRQVSESARKRIGLASKGRKQSAVTIAKRTAALTGCLHRDNRTGFPGVGLFRDRFRARYAGKHLGIFATAEEAYAAVRVAMGLLDGSK